VISSKQAALRQVASGGEAEQTWSRRCTYYCVYLAGLIVAFVLPLSSWVRAVAGNDLNSYTLLIPVVSIYLIYIQCERLLKNFVAAPSLASLFILLGFAGVILAVVLPRSAFALSNNDESALYLFSFVSLVVAGGFLFLGKTWMKAAAFPMAFLIFMVPMPEGIADGLEEASKLASAEVAHVLFQITGTPVLREGVIFQLPGISIEVARECSGIRSSVILFITSLLASYLFLRSNLRRFVLVAAVIPLGLIRNGVRILTIALLCVHYGPGMIDSPVHRHGGPPFFVASLIPLFLLLWWLRRGEQRRPLPSPA